jgi:hypothetical protein
MEVELPRQFADCNCPTETPYACPILVSVSPRRIVYSTQLEGGPQDMFALGTIERGRLVLVAVGVGV